MASILVVGAGVMGLSCAIALAGVGARVGLIDPRSRPARPGGDAASAAAAGLLAPWSEAMGEAEGTHSGLCALGRESLALWQADPIWRQLLHGESGALFVAAGAEGERLRAVAGQAGAQVIYGGALRKRAPVLGFKAAIAAHFADERHVEAPAALAALEAVAGAAGTAWIMGRARTVAPGQVTLESGETHAAEAIILAPGADAAAPSLAPELALLEPVKGHMVRLADLPAPLAQPIRGPGFYLVPQTDGSALLGSTMQTGRADRDVEPPEVRKLLARVYAYAPRLKEARIVEAWAGVRALSPDRAPLIGPARMPGVFLAAGAGRNGWLLAPVTARIISAYVCGDDIPAAWRAFAPGRFTPQEAKANDKA